jgi:hypothetical protein
VNYLIAVLLMTIGSASAKTTTNNSCQFLLNENLCAKVWFKNGISRKIDSTFEINFLDTNGKEVVLVKAPDIKLWMVMKSGHGHGSEKLKIKKENNSYLVENAWFLMVGEWQIKLELEYNGLKVQKEIPVCVGRKPEDSKVGTCAKHL